MLIKLERMRGVWQPIRLNTLSNFSKLLDHIPQELLRALNRIANFWDDITSLSGLKDHRNEDIERITGLWPKVSKIDKELFVVGMTDKTLFPNVTETKARKRIQETVVAMDCRVPTLSIIQAEVRALLSIVGCLYSALKSCGGDLRESAI